MHSKSLIIGLLMGVMVVACIAAGVRERFYKEQGPRMTEALALVTLDEINILRVKAGLTARTTNQLVNAIMDKLDSVPDYESRKRNDTFRVE